MAQCQSIFFHVLVWLLLSQQVFSVVVLLLPLTWLQPPWCLFVELALLVDLQKFCVVLNRIDHVFDRSIGNSNPIMRIVLIHGLNSNFNSIIKVLETGRDFQYRSNPHLPLNPSFWLRS